MLAGIIQEIKLQKRYLEDQTVETIYFGGGTPSLLSGDEVSKIIEAIQTHYILDKDLEITLEANPDDLNLQKLREFRGTEINRFSIGVQSFFDEDLKWMNRAHQSDEAESAIKRAQDFGFENLTIDLIYGFPLLIDQKWVSNIAKAIEFQIPHISSYSMTVESKTALANFINTQKQPPLDDAQSARQFQTLIEKLTSNGFEHYEISNFAKPNQYSKHNTNYWLGVHYLGIGPSAHSFNGESRQWNIANNAKYLGELALKNVPFDMEILSLNNRFNEYIMTSLRTMWGVDLKKVILDFGSQIKGDLMDAADEYISKNWLALADEKLTLTLQGKLYADLITSELFRTENELQK